MCYLPDNFSQKQRKKKFQDKGDTMNFKEADLELLSKDAFEMGFL